MMLTKSDFLTYLDAPMHLWAKAHDRCEPKAPTPFEQFLIQQSQQVETLARTYIENEILPHYEDARLLWQPSYNDGRFEVRADALVWDRTAQAYDLFEIKSAASVHPEHTYDLAFQVLLLESILKLRHTTIIHINKGYLYGDSLDLSQFFTFEEISDKVQKRRESIAQLRQEAWHVTRLEKPQPVFACINPRTCPCPDLCHPSLPSNPVYDLPYLGKKVIKLREMGITAIEDIPESFNLNPKQSKLVQAVKHRQPMIETSMIRQALSELRFPLHFLDYETFSPAIPLFPDYHPYEHILFQYSLVIVDAPQAAPKRIDFLFTENKDPAPSFATHLLSHLGTMGSVIVWNQGFEASRNKQLARHCPKQAYDLLAINERLFDLMRIFKDGLYIHPAFHGSASLKTVLPVLCPELGYEGLRINSGEEASLTWYHLHKGLIPGEKQAEIKAALKAYCYNDTFGLYAIWKHLFAL